MAYRLEGRLLEVCECKVLCPCWIGEDPDNGICQSSLAYGIDRGEIGGIDVSGLTVAVAAYIPGNVLKGNFRAGYYVSKDATDEQFDALEQAFRGSLGGPLGDLSNLVAEILEFRRADITFEVRDGRGRYRVDELVEADMEPYRGPTGEVTQLVESIFSTIPGSPAYVAKALEFRMKHEGLGIDLDLQGHNAIQGHFLFEG
jgi:hypothetical protein